MNRILMTGVSLGIEVGASAAFNFNFEWLIRYPSALIFADKILVTETILETISNELYPTDSKELAKLLKLIFSIAKSDDIIEIQITSDENFLL